MTAQHPTLEQRVAHLERNSETEETLSAAVDRLAREAVGLNSLLTRVDQQQTDLAELGRELARVKETAVTADDVAEHERRQRELRNRFIIRVVVFVVFAISVLGTAIAYTTNQSYHACVSGQHRVDVQESFYKDVASQTPAGNPFRKRIDTAVADLEATRADCGKSYPIHWGSK